MTIQAMLDIAGRYHTAIADAMVIACVAWALDHGVTLKIPRGGHSARGAERRPGDGMDFDEWKRLAEGNSDSRWNHT